ncbi:restriction endonuclease subunit S, partial [Helicobacter sp. 12S02634-8]|uniref:restriction endonuclease subunit S n=1 Tax=Helicobacter sp. 12S02634-8 TaxID=1476199 RepID=UPI001C0E99F0
INDNLVQMAKTIYDYWFTQFDFPDENGKPYRSSGGQMVWNEQLKREIPAEWEVMSISTYTSIYQPQTISNSLFDDNYNCFVYGGGGFIGKYSDFNHTDAEVIISCRGNCGNVYMTMPKSWITGNAMVVHPVDNTLSKEYIYQFINSYGVEKYVSGSVQKQLTRENLSLMKIVIPNADILNKFNALMQVYRKKQEELILENQELVKLRDWLLPMLMNGQATVVE